MPTAVTFHKRVPQGSRGSLAELMARQAEAARASTSAQDIQTPTIMQGLGKLGQIGAGVFNERRAAKAEASSREALAKLIAGVGEGGATQQQVADMGLHDQVLAEQYRREAVESRVRADELARKEADYKRDIGREDFTWEREQRDQAADEARQAAAAARVTAGERKYQDEDQIADEARQAAAAAGVEADKRDYEGGIRIQERNQKAQDAQNQFNREYALKAEERKQALADAAAKPAGEIGQFMADVQKYNNGDYGDPRDPDVQQMFAAIARKQTAIGKGTQISFDPETGAFNFEQGGVEGEAGDVLGGTQATKNISNELLKYREDQKAANSALPGIDAMEKAFANAGPGGPLGGMIGTTDDFLEAYGPAIGLPGEHPFLGTSSARQLVTTGGLAQVLEKVQQTIGAVSNVEMGIFGNASVSLNSTPQGRKMLAGMARAIIQRANERAEGAAAYASKYGTLAGDATRPGFEQSWNEYINANPIIGVDDSGAPTILQPGQQQPQQPVVPDAAAPAAAPVAPAVAAQGAADVDAILQELDAEEAAPPPPVVAPGLRERLERQRAGSMGRR